MKRLTNFTYVFIAGLFLMTGCDAVTDAGNETDAALMEDVAINIADDIAEDTGGALDQFNDVMLLVASEGGAGKTAGRDFDRIYDPVTQTWTARLFIEKKTEERFISVLRIYQYQFLDASGAPQADYVVNGDTARTLTFEVVEGSGLYQGPHASHELTELDGDWVVEDINTDIVTITGSYSRAGLDTLTNAIRERTSDHTLDLTFTDLVVPRPVHFFPRNPREKLSKVISGTLSGTYHADNTLTRGNGTATETIDRNFTIVFDNGNARMSIGDETFTADAQTGTIK